MKNIIINIMMLISVLFMFAVAYSVGEVFYLFLLDSGVFHHTPNRAYVVLSEFFVIYLTLCITVKISRILK